MTNMELKELDLVGQIVELIDRTAPVQGWDLWCKTAEVNAWSEQDQANYRKFKRELTSLERMGYLAITAKGSSRARSSWDLTEEGETWWTTSGREDHTVKGTVRREQVDDFITGKWMQARALPKQPSTWSKIAAMALRGEIRVAIKYADEENRR